MSATSRQVSRLNGKRLFGLQVFAAFVLLAILSYLFPFTGDDWAWGSSIGLQRLESGFANYNGRYVGNLLVLFLTRFPVIKAIITSLTCIGIALAINKIIAKDNHSLFWLSLLLILAMPSDVRAQTIVWTSGFTNYVVPAFGIMLYVLMFKGSLKAEYRQNSKLIIPSVCLGFVNSLIMENVSIYNVGVSSALLLFTRAKHGFWDKSQVAFLFGAIAGCGLMFSNGAYGLALSSETGYQTINTSGPVATAISLFWKRYTSLFCCDNLVLNALVACIVIAFLARAGKVPPAVIITAAAIGALLLLASALAAFGITLITTKITRLVFALATVGLVAELLALAVHLARTQNDFAMLFYVCSMLALILPLFVVSPVGPRNVFPIYTFGILICCYLWNKTLPDRLTSRIAIPACAILYAALVVIYATVHFAETERLAQIQAAVENGESTVRVEKLPFPEDLWNANPTKGTELEKRYKLFYGFPADLDILCE
ncbi:DUF6056 family protein [Parvibacter caecicola]|uniref:Uncharacterized protein n=1 Tax=Parvibacter caecicola TaxID=747645 RepID=A0A4T9TAT3_9ACTN|nr:DUF6056 family protein [Parvibacter caecicola]TJW11345.1 hypothetical protein E5982_03820 [Parvibacter caecicola]